MKLCPTCKRRPSERHAMEALEDGPGAVERTCHAEIHDRADACEEMYEIYLALKGCTWKRTDGGENKLAVAMANAALALARGEKEEETDGDE